MNTDFESTLTPHILMVCTEYPPMIGGVGRYTFNLTNALRKIGFNVQVVCNRLGNGDFFGLSPSNTDDSNVLLELVDKIKPDIVHLQYEQGMYGLILDGLDPRKTRTNIDSFYDHCRVPIVTTFHSAYTIRQWLNLVVPSKFPSRAGILKKYSNNTIVRYWKRILNYHSFHNLNKEKVAKSAASIVFSNYMSKMIGGGGQVILHGAESNSILEKGQIQTRKIFDLPQKSRIALALGFATATKGWDILNKMNIPSGWTIVINSSTNHYSTEKCDKNYIKNGIIDLRKDFLSEEELSLLFSSADAVILPYKVSSGSGVMFDALAHGLPFVATDLDFFNEFSRKGLGITVKRNPEAFSKALADLDNNYITYKSAVDEFRPELSWQKIASQHGQLYSQIVKIKSSAVITASSVRK